MGGSAFAIRFEIPRSELERARAAAAAGSGQAFLAGLEREHFRGHVEFEIGVPFAPDPVLEFLARRRGARLEAPHRVSLPQPVAHVVGQFAAQVVMAAHGEGPLQFTLSGGRGAIGVDREGDHLAVSLPLDQYAGVAVIPAKEVAAAAARACTALTRLLQDEAPELAAWPLLGFLQREVAILEGVGAITAREAGPPVPFVMESLFGAAAPGLAGAARDAEKGGAHVIPLWDVRPAAGSKRALRLDPIRLTKEPRARGALTRFIYPDRERLLLARCSSDPTFEPLLQNLLRKGLPFIVDLAGTTPRVESAVAPRSGPPSA